MRYGFTTGSCAAAAAKAAAYMLLTGKIKNCIMIETPKGIPYTAEVTDIVRGESQVSCAVVKDGGDDPDVTSGSKICATVTADNGGDGEKELLQIDGGKGVGRVTRPGLDQPVGNAAINHVPREMITREVQEVCRLCDFHGTLQGINMFNATKPKIAKQTYSTPSTLFRRIFVDSTPPQAVYNSIRITDRIPVISSKAT